ncbi:MAG: protein-disulfide reductase DsbD domain-containing protein [Armatimonadota bacterium]
MSNTRLSLSVAAAAAVVVAGYSVFSPLVPAIAQPASVVTTSGGVKPGVVARGGKGEVMVTLAIKPGWHVYASDPGNPSYIPTTVSAKGANGVTFGKPRFPKAESLKTSVDPKPVNVYQGKATIAIPFTVAKTAKPGKQKLTASVGYQTFNDQTCLPPETVPVTAMVTVK